MGTYECNLTPMFSCRGLFSSKFENLILHYLMLGHNPTIGRPCLLQHVVRPPLATPLRVTRG